MKRFALITAAILIGVAAMAVVLMHLPATSPGYLAAGASMAPPDGYLVMCAAQPYLCQTEQASKTPPRDLRAVLVAVNSEINRRMVQRPDPAGDVWQVAITEGDCEDLALAKRLMLAALGFPPDRLFLAVAWLPENGRHTVLIARLDDGDVILDNRFSYLLPVGKAGWRWISMQSSVEPLAWFEAAA